MVVFTIIIWTLCLLVEKIKGVDIPFSKIELEPVFMTANPDLTDWNNIKPWNPIQDTNDDITILLNSSNFSGNIENLDVNYTKLAMEVYSFIELHANGQLEKYTVNESTAEYAWNSGHNENHNYTQYINGDRRRFAQIGDDTREIAGNFYPYNTYGLLFFYRPDTGLWSYCTGALVYSHHVLTSGNCLYWNGVWSQQITFYPNYPYTIGPNRVISHVSVRVPIPWYNSYDYNFDLGLVILTSSYSSSSYLNYGFNDLLSVFYPLRSCGYPFFNNVDVNRYITTFYPAFLSNELIYDLTSDVTGYQNGSPVYYYSTSTNSFIVIGVYSHSSTGWLTSNVWTRITEGKASILDTWIVGPFG